MTRRGSRRRRAGRRGERLVEGDAGADEGDLVLGAGAQHLAAADRELLVGPVDHRGVGAGGAQVGDAGAVAMAGTAWRLVGVAG